MSGSLFHRIGTLLRNHAFALCFLSLIAVPAVNLLPFAVDTDIKTQFILFAEVFFGYNVIWSMRHMLSIWLVRVAFVTGLTGSIVSAINISPVDLQIKYVLAACFFTFYFILAYAVFKRVLHHTVTNRETLFAALSGYLLIGFIGFFLFMELQQIIPGSFSVTSTGRPAQANELFYFAFVTIMTIGYGDIAPVTWPARNATILMAILGYTYSLVFIARVVNDLGSVSRARMRKTETEDEAGNTKTGPDA